MGNGESLFSLKENKTEVALMQWKGNFIIWHDYEVIRNNLAVEHFHVKSIGSSGQKPLKNKNRSGRQLCDQDYEHFPNHAMCSC